MFPYLFFFSFFMIAVIWLFKKYTVFSQVGILLQSIKRKIFIKIYNFSFFFKCEELLENIEKCKKKEFFSETRNFN